MPNWDRYCTNCGFNGSYLDFEGDPMEPKSQRCRRTEGCGKTVRYEDQDAEDLQAAMALLRKVADIDCVCQKHPTGCPGGDCDGCAYTDREGGCLASRARRMVSDYDKDQAGEEEDEDDEDFDDEDEDFDEEEEEEMKP